MYYDSFLPFLHRSPVGESRQEVINAGDLYFPCQFQGPMAIVNQLNMISEQLKHRYCKVFRVKPLNLLVMQAPPLIVYWYRTEGLSLSCPVFDLDYGRVANDIEVVEDELGNLVAQCWVSNSTDSQPLLTDSFVVAAANGVELSPLPYLDIPFSVPEFMKGPFMQKPRFESVESLVEMDDTMLSKYASGAGLDISTTRVTSSLEAYLETYLLSGYQTESVPLLLGPTAVLKSATIKALCAKHNMRLVDMRISFMSRLDFEGLSHKFPIEGKMYSENAPMLELVECTDAYVNYARQAVVKIEEHLSKAPPDSREAAELKRLLDIFKEKAKVPVVFFDEVTRADSSVRNALTQILNKKQFLGYDMKIARFVAASNHPLELADSKPELAELYHVAEISDVANLERFKPIPVRPEDVADRWFIWAKSPKSAGSGEQNIHPLVVEFLEGSPGYVYDYSEPLGLFDKTQDLDDISTAPFPNYRTWQFVSDYLYSVGARSAKAGWKINPEIVHGCIGQKAGKAFLEFLSQKGYEIEKVLPEDSMDRFVEDSFVHNLPSILVGPSSCGKSARVKNFAKKLGCTDEDIIDINLGMQDRTDIMGPPTKVTTALYVGADVAKVSTELAKELTKLADQSGLPPKITVKAPKSLFAEKVAKATPEHPLILFFDEVNRCVNETVMSSVFEAISDHRIFGVNFDPRSVRIVLACNLGASTNEAKSLDPAFSARVLVKRKREYDMSDVKAFRNYIKRNNYNPILVNFIESCDDNKLLEMISSVEKRTITSSVPSMRAWSDLNKKLSDPNTTRLLAGTVLFPDEALLSQLDEILNRTHWSTEAERYAAFSKIAQRVKKVIDGWAALGLGFTINVGDTVRSVEELVSDFKDIYSRLFTSGYSQPDSTLMEAAKTIFRLLYAVDQRVVTRRREVVSFDIGQEAAQLFTGFYNLYSGSELRVYEIPDLHDLENIEPFFKQKLSSAPTPNDRVNLMVSITKEFLAYFKNTLSIELYQRYLQTMMDFLPTPDSRLALLTTFASDREGLDKLFEYIEAGGFDFMREMLSRAGVNVTNDEVERAQKKKKVYAQ